MATSDSTTFNFVDCFKSNAITLAVAIYLIVIAYYMTKDPEKLFTKIYLYATIAVVPILAGVIYTLNKSGTIIESNDYIKYGAVFIAFLLVIFF